MRAMSYLVRCGYLILFTSIIPYNLKSYLVRHPPLPTSHNKIIFWLTPPPPRIIQNHILTYPPFPPVTYYLIVEWPLITQVYLKIRWKIAWFGRYNSFPCSLVTLLLTVSYSLNPPPNGEWPHLLPQLKYEFFREKKLHQRFQETSGHHLRLTCLIPKHSL